MQETANGNHYYACGADFQLRQCAGVWIYMVLLIRKKITYTVLIKQAELHLLKVKEC